LASHTTIPESFTLQPRVFGCSVFVHIPKIHRSKFDPCSLKCVFVGYGTHQKGYRCYHPSSRRLYTTLDCKFVETEFFYSTQLSDQGEIQTIGDPLSCFSVPSYEQPRPRDED
ncbi:Unknown protein, partial [Striga hermonthica]